MSSTKFNDTDFKQFVLKQIKLKKNQRLCSKLRGLSKAHNNNSYFEEAIDTAVIKYENLKNLAISRFAEQIQNLKLSVPVELEYLSDLCYISIKYFVNIKSIKMRFIQSDINSDVQFFAYRQLEITENFSIRGLTVAQNEHVRKLKIRGKFDVSISNSKFYGLEICTDENANVKLTNVKFYNSVGSGFSSQNCTSVTMKDILLKNCRNDGLYFYRCQKVFVSNIDVQKCGYSGFTFMQLSDFQVTNAKISECRSGIYFYLSKGRIINVFVSKCEVNGVDLTNSQVRYDGFLCIDNGGDDVGVDDYDDDQDDASEFIQGV